MGDTSILSLILATLGISIVANIVFKKFDIPQVLGYILTGVIIAEIFNISLSIELMHIAEFGIVFLMFMIGLEISVDKMKSMKREVLIFGGAQVTLTALLFFMLSHYLFGLDTKESIVIGFAFALSSTAIVLKILNESRDIQKPYGLNSLGILIFQDMAVIPILLLITLLSGSDKSVGELLIDTTISAVVVFFIIFIAGKYLISLFLRFASETKLDEVFVGSILFIVIGSASLAHYFGFSYSLGAFLAGMVISETKYRHQTQADLEHFRDILLGIFFVTVGLQIDIGYAIENLSSILGMLVAILILKALIIFTIIKIFSKTKTAFKSAIALSQVGEFSFAVFELSKSNYLLSESLSQKLILVVVLSMIVTPFILKKIDKITEFFIREKDDSESLDVKVDGLNHHIVVCGYGLAGQKLVEKLQNIQAEYIAIDKDSKSVKEGLKRGDRVIYGDISKKSILKECHIERAISAIVVINNSEQLPLIVENILELSNEINVVVRVVNDSERDMMLNIDDDRVKIVDDRLTVGEALIDSAMVCKI